jgi:broad specificity phosphatase PhoE
MFEYVQERETGTGLTPKTMVYVITTGESDSDDPDKLSERGENQVMEMALSRVVAGVRRIYTSTSNLATATSKILAKEFNAKVQKRDCLDDVVIGKKEELQESLKKMWKDEDYVPPDGESLLFARERIGYCLGELAHKHRDDVFAVVTHPLIGFLFHTLVTAAPLDIDTWLASGHASCASYDYSRKGWSEVMPPDNSFQSDPSTVADSFPDGYFK